MNKTSVLLLNIGSPQSTRVKDVRSYLKAFLSDPRVVDIPYFLRLILLYGFILPFRPKKVSKAYQKVWRQEGAPLPYFTQRFAQSLSQHLGEHYHVAVGLQYSQPSVEQALQSLLPCEHLIIFPLFPQYSSAATGSAIEQVLSLVKKKNTFPKITVLNDFFNRPEFVESQKAMIQSYLKQHAQDQKIEHWLFSYHGVPERHIDKSGCVKSHCSREVACPKVDKNNRYCYRAQCFETSKLLAQSLSLDEAQYSVAFQSRLGRTPWIKPYSDHLLPALREKGIERIAVACPSFVADCLETLEEVGMGLKSAWEDMGGKTFILLPCLNDHEQWVTAVADWVQRLH